MPHVILAFARVYKHHREGRDVIPIDELENELRTAGVQVGGKDCVLDRLVKNGLVERVNGEYFTMTDKARKQMNLPKRIELLACIDEPGVADSPGEVSTRSVAEYAKPVSAMPADTKSESLYQRAVGFIKGLYLF